MVKTRPSKGQKLAPARSLARLGVATQASEVGGLDRDGDLDLARDLERARRSQKAEKGGELRFVDGWAVQSA
jgi:hypothetical protein